MSPIFTWNVSISLYVAEAMALELDNLQCQMLCHGVTCVRLDDESIDVFCRRRKRAACEKSGQLGPWSILWCKRVINWNAHLKHASEVRIPHFL